MLAPGGAWRRIAHVLPARGPRCSTVAAAHGIAVDAPGNEVYVATDCGVAAGNRSLSFSNYDVGAADSRFYAIAALGDGDVIASGQSGCGCRKLGVGD